MKCLSTLIILLTLFTACKKKMNIDPSWAPEKYQSVDGSKIEVYSKPESSSKIIGTLEDSVIVITDMKIKDNVRGKEGTWMLIKFDDEEAFVFSAGITKANPYTYKNPKELEKNPERIKELLDNFVLPGTTFNYGFGCTGDTASEYTETLKFIDDSHIYLTYIDSENKHTASGTYIREGNNVKITITKSSMNMKSNNMNLTLKVCDDFPKCEKIILHNESDPVDKNYAESSEKNK